MNLEFVAFLHAHSDGERMVVQAVDEEGEIHCVALAWTAARDLASQWLRLAVLERPAVDEFKPKQQAGASK